jgi:hypothetical protein
VVVAGTGRPSDLHSIGVDLAIMSRDQFYKNSTSAETFPDKFSSSNFGQIYTQNQDTFIYL